MTPPNLASTPSAGVAGLRLSPSALVLVAANLVPLAGVLFFGWSVFATLLLFWVANVIVGPRGESRRVVCVQLHRRGRVPHGRTGQPDVPAVRSRDGAARRDPGGRLSRPGAGGATRRDRPARRLEDRPRPRRARAGACRPGRRRSVRLSHPAGSRCPRVARSPRPGPGDDPAKT